MALEDGSGYVADTNNHRIQMFSYEIEGPDNPDSSLFTLDTGFSPASGGVLEGPEPMLLTHRSL